MITVGDYVLATKYGDMCCGDPWFVGFVYQIETLPDNQLIFKMKNSDGTPYHRSFKNVIEISKEQGDFLVENSVDLERNAPLEPLLGMLPEKLTSITTPIATPNDMLVEVKKIYDDAEICSGQFNKGEYTMNIHFAINGQEYKINRHQDNPWKITTGVHGTTIAISKDPQKVLKVLRAIKECEGE